MGKLDPKLAAVLIILLHSNFFLSAELRPDLTISFHIVEEVPSGTLIGNLLLEFRLTDVLNQQQLEDIQFNFLTPPQVEFDLDSTSGTLSTAGILDREEICPWMDLCTLPLDIEVQAPDFYKHIRVNLEVQDINDNTPEFSRQSVAFEIPENSPPGRIINLPKAVDADSPRLGIVDYRLLNNGDLFEISGHRTMNKSLELRMTLKYILDREVQDKIFLKLEAEDGGGLKGQMDVEVTVLDTNDNVPQFTHQEYVTYIHENNPIGTGLIQVLAFDADKGLNSEVRFDFTPHTKNYYGDLLQIDQITGIIRCTRSLDYEETNTLYLGVIAKDMGEPALTAMTTVIINVLDINDNPPQITVNTLSESDNAFVEAWSPYGTFVAHITVVDQDSGENGDFTCYIDNDNFRLVMMYEGEYKLITNTIFGMDTPANDVSIICQSPPYQTIETLTVIVVQP